jgi:diguanylate cyclase (GGDEF)-like protein
MSIDFVERVLKAENLPSLPIVALEVLNLTRRDDVSIDALAKVVQNDPALTAKILKVVNSSMFGIPREIGSIRQAMVILGLRTVKVLTLSFALVDSVQKTGDSGLNVAEYWRRSLTTSVAARLLAKIALPRQTEEAFVAGLLSDLGLFAAWRCAPAEYSPVFAAAQSYGEGLCEIEARTFGVTHADLSRELLRKWNLPESVCAAVGAHHGKDIEQLTGESRALANVVFAATRIADVFCGHTPAAKLDEVRSRSAAQLGVNPESINEAMAALEAHVKETASLLSLDIGATTGYAQLQLDAAAQLASVGMEAEMERAAASRREEAARNEAQRLQAEKAAILEVASTDGLTRVANRAAFDRRLEEELGRAETGGRGLGLILLDVDHFKRFNDTHGHQAGDEVLRQVAACLRDVAGSAGLVARYGGEEFAVICLEDAANQVRSLAESIRAAIEARPVNYEGKTLRVTASLGVSYAEPKRRRLPAEIVESADRRLYAAKRGGRNRVDTSA